MSNKTVTTGTLTFQVHGEFVTKFFRRLYEHGQELEVVVGKLTHSINDLPDDIARDIILGKKKFEGINTFTLLPDSQTITSYKEDMKRMALDKLRVTVGYQNYEHGWVSPEGDFFPCQYMEHIGLLVELQKQDITDEASERLMEKKGWMKLSKGEFHYYAFMGVRDDRMKPMTNAQRTFIYAYAFEKGLSKITINSSPIPMKGIFDFLDKEYGEEK